ncbi:MAG: hypothetical protein ACQESA_01265, partial [Patescibacteria group bacterium]
MLREKKVSMISTGVFLGLLFIIIMFMISQHLFASTSEELEPDSVLEITNLSPNDISVLQDDPDDPQNNDWLNADSHDDDTLLRVSFSDPLNSLVEGNDLQEFRVLIRSTNNGSEDPEVSLYLYENGTQLKLLTTETATSTSGQVISGSWNATELTDSTGSDVELRVVGSSTNNQLGDRDTIEVGAIKWGAEMGEPDLVQDDFRFYENRDDVTPTVELAGLNGPVTAVAQDEVLRLRINAYGENGGIPKDYLSSTLQYAALDGEASCSSVATSSFVSVGGVGTGEIWRGYSNATSSDGADLSSLLLSSSNIMGTYEEENPTKLLPREATEGERVEWDFVVQNNGAESNETYCFRLVKDGSQEFSRYDNFAEAEVIRGLTQVRYRWRNDDGAEDVATWKEAENTPATLSVDENSRLRVQVDNEGNVSDTASFQLEYATSTAGPWNNVPVDNPECATTSSAFRICNSDLLTDAATTTRQLSEITGSTFIPGHTLDDSNPSPSVNFNTDEYTEIEWSIQATQGADSSEVYYFRLSDNGELVGTYSKFPEAEVEVDNALLNQNYYRWYEHNDQLTPNSAWSGLGENTAITSSNDPPRESDLLRLRMSLTANEDLLPANARDFDLQYAKRESSCGATSGWSDVGDIGSSTIWRGTSTSVSDGAELTSLLLSVSDTAGTFEEENPSAVNPNEVLQNNDVEYDWVLEQNGAEGNTAYCFRMVESDGTELSGYNYYPVLTTAGFTPKSGVWRWYSDAESITPQEPLSSENSAPVDLDFDDVVKLRVAVS